MPRVLGLDLGGVVIDTPTRITLPYEEALAHIRRVLPDTRPTASFATIRAVLSYFDHVWLVSAASDIEVERLTVQWLEHVDFWTETGLRPEHLRFCGIAHDAKATLVQGLDPVPTHALDDRSEYLRAMAGIVPYRTLYDRGEGEPNLERLPVVRSIAEYYAQLMLGLG